MVAGATRLELATSGVTGRRSNQLNYAPDLLHRFHQSGLAAFYKIISKKGFYLWWAEQGLNLRHSACKADALPSELSARKKITASLISV
jgi:hypothetical protein